MVEDALQIAGQFLSYTWWFLLYLALWPLFQSTWRFWREELYLHSKEFKGILYEIRLPMEIHKSPQAMEQVLAAIHQLRNAPGDVEEWWIDGEITKWFSFEMVSLGGEVHFFVRIPYYKQRHLVEAAFFAFYQDIELLEVEDYVNRIPSTVREMYAQGYNLWGSEMILTKPDAYPIKTYLDFESPDEEKQYDPISAFVELLAKVKPEEIVAVQLVAAAAAPLWTRHYEHLVEDLRIRQETGKSSGGKGGMMSGLEMQGVLPALPEHGDPDKKPFTFIMRTPGETDVLKKVEENLSKPAFETVARFIYLSPQPTFYDSFPRRGLAGAFNQYMANDLNSFMRNDDMSTKTKIWEFPYLFPKLRNEYRKSRLLYTYRHRLLPPETFMGKLLTSFFFNWNFNTRPFHFTTQCIATVFHPPTSGVLTGPHVKRMESRKVGPPAGLAIFGEETDLERFQ